MMWKENEISEKKTLSRFADLKKKSQILSNTLRKKMTDPPPQQKIKYNTLKKDGITSVELLILGEL